MNEIDKKKSFEERMKDRIRDSIGELMTDEELSKIVKKTTENIFFESITVNDGYGTKKEPPFIHEIIKELLTDSVSSKVQLFFVENKDEILKSINQVVKDGIGSALLSALTEKFKWDLQNFQSNLMNSLQ